MKDLKSAINEFCPENIYETGYALLKGLLGPRYSGYSYGISIARRLDDAVIDCIVSGPTPEYFDLYNKINSELNSRAAEIADFLVARGSDARPVKATVDEGEFTPDYLKTLRHDFSHKLVATRSGLGWIGKTDLFISKRFGPRVRLASVLTAEAVSAPGIPVTESLCGNCSICVKSCPAGAANGMAWNINVDRNEFYDPFKCMEWCRKITAEKLNRKKSICGICVSVCPAGKRAWKPQ